KDLIAFLDHGLVFDDLKSLDPGEQQKLRSLLCHWADLVGHGDQPACKEATKLHSQDRSVEYQDAMTLGREVIEQLAALFQAVRSEATSLEQEYQKTIGVSDEVLATFRPSDLSCLIALGCDTAIQWASDFRAMAEE